MKAYDISASLKILAQFYENALGVRLANDIAMVTGGKLQFTCHSHKGPSRIKIGSSKLDQTGQARISPSHRLCLVLVYNPVFNSRLAEINIYNSSH